MRGRKALTALNGDFRNQQTLLFEQVNAMAMSNPPETQVASKGYMLHLVMYGVSLMGELTELRRQYRNNKFVVFYFSKGINNIQLFLEFLFEIINEKDEPLVCLVELAKAACKLLEFRQLVARENINSYIELESYRELKLLKEIKENHLRLMRSKKQVLKLQNFTLAPELQALKQGVDPWSNDQALLQA